MSGMISTRTVYCGLKLFVSALAAVLLFKLFINGSPDLYSTVFIFIADKVIDTFFSTSSYESYNYQLWGIVNSIGGCVACLFALIITFWTDDGSTIFEWVLIAVQLFFVVCIISYLARDAIQAIYYPLMRRQIISKINLNAKNRGTNHG